MIQNLPQVEYFDCTNPATRRQFDHPLEVFSRIGEGRVAIDEINRLVDPFGLLALIKEHFPGIAIVATASVPSAIHAQDRELNPLRLSDLWLTPMISADLADFQSHDLQQRFLRGGLPPFFTANAFPERDFQLWMDDYWLNSVQDSFRVALCVNME